MSKSADEYDDWQDSGDGTTVEAECQHCGKVKPCQFLPDPFIAEIYPDDENDPEWWCRDCYEHRSYEI